MLIIGCDFHTRYQQIAMADEETGELLVERRLDHGNGEAAKFYQSLQKPVRVGIEATGPIHWFERLLAELGHELWIGDSAKIRASEVRKQKTDERDARLILDLLLSKRFPKIWVPTPAERDLRQLLWHRHKLVTLRTMLGNQLHFLAMSQGLCRKQKLFSKKGRGELTGLALGPWASRRREELLKLLDQLDPAIAELDRAVLEEAKRREDAVLLMTHPGIGPVTSLAFVLAIGPVAFSLIEGHPSCFCELRGPGTIASKSFQNMSQETSRENSIRLEGRDNQRQPQADREIGVPGGVRRGGRGRRRRGSCRGRRGRGVG
jgi:transposase